MALSKVSSFELIMIRKSRKLFFALVSTLLILNKHPFVQSTVCIAQCSLCLINKQINFLVTLLSIFECSPCRRILCHLFDLLHKFWFDSLHKEHDFGYWKFTFQVWNCSVNINNSKKLYDGFILIWNAMIDNKRLKYKWT